MSTVVFPGILRLRRSLFQTAAGKTAASRAVLLGYAWSVGGKQHHDLTRREFRYEPPTIRRAAEGVPRDVKAGIVCRAVVRRPSWPIVRAKRPRTLMFLNVFEGSRKCQFQSGVAIIAAYWSRGSSKLTERGAGTRAAECIPLFTREYLKQGKLGVTTRGEASRNCQACAAKKGYIWSASFVLFGVGDRSGVMTIGNRTQSDVGCAPRIALILGDQSIWNEDKILLVSAGRPSGWAKKSSRRLWLPEYMLITQSSA